MDISRPCPYHCLGSSWHWVRTTVAPGALPLIFALIKLTSSPFPPASRPMSSMRPDKRSLAPTRKASFPLQVNLAIPLPPAFDCPHVHSGDKDTSQYICLVYPRGRSLSLIHRLISVDGKQSCGNDATATRTHAVCQCLRSTVRTTRRQPCSSRMQ
jgi:hypothetical protein